jgi:hypothetical protein
VTENDTTLPKAAPDSRAVFVPTAARLRMLWVSPGTVLDIALVITVRLGTRRQEAFGSSLVDPRA